MRMTIRLHTINKIFTFNFDISKYEELVESVESGEGSIEAHYPGSKYIIPFASVHFLEVVDEQQGQASSNGMEAREHGGDMLDSPTGDSEEGQSSPS